MIERPEALYLADMLESDPCEEECFQAAAELRRLHAEAADFHMAYRMKCDEETKAQAVEITRLQAECDALRADAERYRWLRDPANAYRDEWNYFGPYSSEAEIDAVIDAAREAK